MRITRNAAHAALMALGLSIAAGAQQAHAACPPGLPPQVACGTKDMSAVTAGTYKLDESHTAVLARVSHIDYSWSVFRFDRAAGTLAWDPADLGKSKLSVTVQTASVATNVAGFAAQIAGDSMLKSKAFPEATFVSKAFRRIDGTHGEVDGDFTLMGKTAPVTFKVELVGAGAGFGHPRMGVHASAWIKPQDHGLPPMFVDPIELVIDAEFEKAA